MSRPHSPRTQLSPNSEHPARRFVARARAIAALLGLRLKRLKKREPGMRLRSWVEGDDWELGDEEEVDGVGVGHRHPERYVPPYQVRRSQEQRCEESQEQSQEQRASSDARESWDNYRASVDSYTRGSRGLGTRSASLGRSSDFDFHLDRSHSHHSNSYQDNRVADTAAWRRERIHHAVRHNSAPVRWAEMVDWVEVELTERRPDAGRWDKEHEFFRETARIERVVGI